MLLQVFAFVVGRVKAISIEMEGGIGNGLLEFASAFLTGFQRGIVCFLQCLCVLFAFFTFVLINRHETILQ